MQLKRHQKCNGDFASSAAFGRFEKCYALATAGFTKMKLLVEEETQ